MKPTILCLFLALITGLIVPAADPPAAAPDVTSRYEVVESPVLKIYTANDGKHRFVAYLVKWKDSEVIVSDALAQSHYKVGDKITFLAHKTTVGKRDSGTIDSLSFILTRPAAK
ncbi:MAG: hypothetical protein AB1705_19740 [Verrucomicrobiota bacterium]